MFISRLRKLQFGLKSMFILVLGLAIGATLEQWSLPSFGQGAVAWDWLGLDLSQEPPSTFAQVNAPYRGGMHVDSVRPSSPAARVGILPGDIVVRMHTWETATPQDIQRVTSDPTLIETTKLKVCVLRGPDAFYGYLKVGNVK